MSPWLIVLVGFVYAYIALEQGLKGNWALFVVFAGYAFSNVGLFLMASK